MTQATSAARSGARRNGRGENTRTKLLEAALILRLSRLPRHQHAGQTVVERAASGATDPGVQLREVTHEYTAWRARRHTMARVVQYEMTALTPQHSAQIADVRREIQGLFERIIAAGAESDRFRACRTHP